MEKLFFFLQKFCSLENEGKHIQLCLKAAYENGTFITVISYFFYVKDLCKVY